MPGAVQPFADNREKPRESQRHQPWHLWRVKQCQPQLVSGLGVVGEMSSCLSDHGACFPACVVSTASTVQGRCLTESRGDGEEAERESVRERSRGEPCLKAGRSEVHLLY